ESPALLAGIPDLSDLDESGRNRGRALIEDAAAKCQAKLVVLDNLSSLVRSGEENSAESWNSFNEWLLHLRREDITTLVVHHSGKRGPNGQLRQRGTSRREDVMNTIIQLDPETATRDEVTGTRCPFKVTIEKHRAFVPKRNPVHL